jgi:carboxylate-amine ligase
MTTRYHLFERFGVELEYMIVERDTLAIVPIADRLLAHVAGEITGEVDVGALRWSNELVLHVVELKTNGPARHLDGLAVHFQRDVARINEILADFGALLMPTGAHPWMDPLRETLLWPHEYNPVYAAFDRIFNCRGHGWSNIQSTHLNLPFADDDEFGRLHTAIRLVLPLLPALAASTPVLDGAPTGLLDARLEHYRHNSARIPSVGGGGVPEPVLTRAQYEREIFAPMYADLAPHDPDGILQHEWANDRTAIARFDRNTIEIRVIDIQECPAADLAILALCVATLRALVDQRWSTTADQLRWTVADLNGLLLRTIRDADAARIALPGFAEQFGVATTPELSAGQLWQQVHAQLAAVTPALHQHAAALSVILGEGPLARRMLTALGATPSRTRQAAVYRELCACLAEGRVFRGAAALDMAS